MIEESKDLTQLTVSELIASLQIHEDRMSRRNEASGEGAFQSKHRISSLKRNKKGGTSNQWSPTYVKVSKNVREKKNLRHVQSVKERIMEKRIAGIKVKLNATIARSLITLKVSVDTKHIKRACQKQ